MSSKRSKSSAPRAEVNRFRSDVHRQYFHKLGQEKITESRVLDQSRLKYDIALWFNQTSLLTLLSLAFAYNREFMFEFYANMDISRDRTTLTSRVASRDVEITARDMREYLLLSTSGDSVHAKTEFKQFDWTPVNALLRKINFHQHITSVAGLTLQGRIVQHVLRTTVLPKLGDRSTISAVLSLATYNVLAGVQFDEVDLIFRHIESILPVRLPQTRRKQNLVLGHVFSYVLFVKYNIVCPQPTDAEPVFYSDKSFAHFYGAKEKRPRTSGEDSDEEEGGAAAEAAGAAGVEDVPHQGEASTSRGTSTFDLSGMQHYLDDRFDRMDGRMERMEGRLERIEARQHELGETFEGVKDNVEWLRRHFSGHDFFPPDD